LRFEWDEDKNNINKIKHGISFQDAERNTHNIGKKSYKK